MTATDSTDNSNKTNQPTATQIHLADQAWQRAMMDSVPQFAVEAIRAIVLTSGGFALIGLAFVGSIYGSDPWQARALVTPIFMLGAGAFSGVICASASYIAQWSFARASIARLHTWEPPYTSASPESGVYRKLGRGFQIGAIIAAVTALGMMVAGGFSAWSVLLA